MRRILLALIMATTVTAFSASPASAIKPTREPLGELEDLTHTGACPFDVLDHIVQNKEILTTFFDQDGDIVRESITGALKTELTNLETMESVVLNISGSGTFVPQEDGSTLVHGKGSWLQYDIANRPRELLWTRGGFHAVSTSDDDYILTDPPGNIVDVCRLLS